MSSKKHVTCICGMTWLTIILIGCNAPTAMPSTASIPLSFPTSSPTSQATPSPITTDTPTPLPTQFQPSVKIIEEEEIVYSWKNDRCADEELPDLPVRAFRDAQGMIQINLSFPTNYRMIGNDLDSLKTDCQVTLTSNEDIDPAQYNYKEWMGSTYTLDGQTIYALIHNEFYGDEASHWYAIRDFSQNQGVSDWYYQSWIGSTYQDMKFDAEHNRWQGSRPLCQIGPNWMHPDLGCEPARAWVSPVDATITISGAARDLDPGGGDGVIAKILKDEELLWSETIENGDEVEHAFSLETPVSVGDRIYFRVDGRGNADYDTTYFNPKINTGPDPCASGLRGRCIMMGVTFAISTDGGRTFTQPPAPDHLVAALPYRYLPDGGQIGIWQPSNIVMSPKDGYYYALIQLDLNRTGRPGQQGMCVMRTQTLEDPKSWRAWDGEGFNMQFINPYVETIANPDEHVCQVVSQKDVGALSYSLTYNSFFDKFVAVGHGVNEKTPGFYYSLSDDLIHWAPKKLLMATDLAQTVNWQPPFLAYPSLIDPDSPSNNFDVSGASPYLYFTRINRLNPLDFDLLRMRIQFSK